MSNIKEIKAVKIPIYTGYLVIAITDDVEWAKKLTPNFTDSQIYAHSIYGEYKTHYGYYVVLNPRCKGSKLTYGVIAHEAAHICNYIFHTIGQQPDMLNDEAQAYLTEWIVEQIHKHLAKNQIKLHHSK